MSGCQGALINGGITNSKRKELLKENYGKDVCGTYRVSTKYEGAKSVLTDCPLMRTLDFYQNLSTTIITFVVFRTKINSHVLVQWDRIHNKHKYGHC